MSGLWQDLFPFAPLSRQKIVRVEKYHQRWVQNSGEAAENITGRYSKLPWIVNWNYLFFCRSTYLISISDVREKKAKMWLLHKHHPFVPTVLQNVPLNLPFELESRYLGNWILLQIINNAVKSLNLFKVDKKCLFIHSFKHVITRLKYDMGLFELCCLKCPLYKQLVSTYILDNGKPKQQLYIGLYRYPQTILYLYKGPIYLKVNLEPIVTTSNLIYLSII